MTGRRVLYYPYYNDELSVKRYVRLRFGSEGAGSPGVGSPSTYPLINTVSDIRDWVKLSHTDEDGILRNLNDAAYDIIENHCNISLTTQVKLLQLDAFPYFNDTAIQIPGAPLQSVQSIIYYDEDNVATEWPAAEYQVDTMADRIIANPDNSYPSVRQSIAGVEITFVGGMTVVPAAVKQAHLNICSFLYHNREAEEMPQHIASLLDPYRIIYL